MFDHRRRDDRTHRMTEYEIESRADGQAEATLRRLTPAPTSAEVRAIDAADRRDPNRAHQSRN